MDIFETLSTTGHFRAFLAGVKIAGAEDVLHREGEWTLFAPTDEAFDKLSQTALDHFLKSREAMAELVAFHMLPGKITTEIVKGMSTRELLQDKRLVIEHGHIQINGARVVHADLQCANGVLHSIDKVLMPSKYKVS